MKRQLAANIRRARHAAGFKSQEALARALSDYLRPQGYQVSLRTVSAWELGERWIEERNLEALSAVLGQDPSWFLVERDPEPIAA